MRCNLPLKLFVPLTLLIMLLLGAACYATYSLSATALRNALALNLKSEAESIQRLTENMLSAATADVLRTAGDPAILMGLARGDEANPAALTEHLRALADSSPFLEHLGVANGKSELIAVSKKEAAGRNPSRSGTLGRAMTERKPALSGIYWSETAQQAMMDVAAPIVANGARIGVVFGVVNLDAFFKNAIAPGLAEKGIQARFLGPDGRAVPGGVTDPAFDPPAGGASLYAEIAADPARSGVRQSLGKSAGLVAAYEKMRVGDLSVLIFAEKDQLLAPLKALQQQTMGVAALGAALGALGVFLILRPALSALKACAGFARRLADGRPGQDILIRRRDEIGMLAEALRDISAHLRNLAAEYRKLAGELIYGEIAIRGDASKFSGIYAALVQNVNALLSRYQLILNVLTSPVIVLDKDTRITFMNDVARKIGGDDYRGKACREIMRREDDGTPDDALLRAVQTLHSAKGETIAHPLGRSLDISYTAVPFTDPETGGLSSALQLITDLTEIKSAQRVIQEVARRATGFADRVASASKELAGRVKEASAGTQVQRDQAASTATAMEEMNAAALEVARNASQARLQANTMSGKARDGARLVDEVIAAITQVDMVAKALETAMQELGRQAENIGGVMVVISDIADQTNLLALNAAIEAARAGEAGRGFAVVASEVRKLAEKTMTATSEVGNSIKGIRNASTSSIARVAEAAEKTGQAAGLVGSSGAALEEILTYADSTSELITGIASAVEQQSATSEEINRSVDQISSIAKQTADGMAQSAAAVQELSSMSEELKTLLGKLDQS